MLWRSTATAQHLPVAATFSIDDSSHLVHYYKGGLLQRCSGMSTTMRPGPGAVCRQCSCSPHGRCPQIWSCGAASEGATLAISTTTSSIQVVCTRASLSEGATLATSTTTSSIQVVCTRASLSEGATLATSTTTSSIQVVCTRASLSERRSAEIHDWSDSKCRQHWVCPSSLVVDVICRPCRVIHTSLNYRRPRVRRR